MGVYIKGMEMPFVGSIKTIVIYPDGTVRTRRQDPLPYTAVPVPPHGRLGDLDRMLADNEIYYNQLGRPDGEIGARYQSVKRSIELAPTIIPASFENPTKNARYSQDNPAEEGRVMVELTDGEATSLCDYLETFFIQNVKDDLDVDSMVWMDNMLTIWRKCGGRKNYADGEAGHD